MYTVYLKCDDFNEIADSEAPMCRRYVNVDNVSGVEVSFPEREDEEEDNDEKENKEYAVFSLYFSEGEKMHESWDSNY